MTEEQGQEEQVQTFTAQEVAQHASATDCWLIVAESVYDVTAFLEKHPGGTDVLLDYAGKNATAAFEELGHSRGARRLLDRYQVGDLLTKKKKNTAPEAPVEDSPVLLVAGEDSPLTLEQKHDEEHSHGKPVTEDFYWEYTEEPHASRRQEILEKYPEIKSLYGFDPNMRYVCLLLVGLQVFLAYVTTHWLPFWAMFPIAFCVGGTCNHMCMLAMHELSHNLGFKRIFHNRIFSLFVNLPIGLPAAISFKRYHLEHHKYQGEDQIDMDIPTSIEGRIFQSRFMKFWFVVFQIFFYALRPILVSPKKPTSWELVNTVCCLGFDAVIYVTMGGWAIFYLLLSTFLGAGLHPVAGHFISEHYVTHPGSETYSYYGPLNIFAFNVGYHNEHHDFPNIPGSRLPDVRRIAAEYYNDLPQCESWPGIQWKYILDPNMTAFSRVKRHTLSAEDIAAVKAS